MLSRLLRLLGIRRRMNYTAVALLDLILEQEHRLVPYSARLIVTAVLWLLSAIHVCACITWLITRVQGFPPSAFHTQLTFLTTPKAHACLIVKAVLWLLSAMHTCLSVTWLMTHVQSFPSPQSHSTIKTHKHAELF